VGLKDRRWGLNQRLNVKDHGWALAAQDPATFEILRVVRDLRAEEVASYHTASGPLWRHLRHQQVLEVVRRNHGEFESALADYAERAAHPLRTLDVVTSIELEVNRIVMNYLAMVRAFLDYTATSLKRDYPDHVQPFEALQSACRQAFDTHFAYRFVYKLRDFALHCGPPIDQVMTVTHWEPSADRLVERRLHPMCRRDRLLDEFGEKWGRPVLRDLQQGEAEFEIAPLLKGMLDCLETINAGVIESYRQDFQILAGGIAELLEPACTQGAIPCFVPSDQEKFRLGSVWLDLLPLDRVAAFLPNPRPAGNEV
jgi:hypothetical protein